MRYYLWWSPIPIPMPGTTDHSDSVTLAVSPAEQWTLHHVLLDWIQRDESSIGATSEEIHPAPVYRAFEKLDDGETEFTVNQLEALQSILAAYHHSRVWEADRSELETLLHRVTSGLDRHDAPQLPE